MLRTIIVDDDAKNIKLLKTILRDYCLQVEVIGEARNLEGAHALIIKSKPDLLFVDVVMPNGTAFDLLDKLMPIEFDVVFVTAHDNFAIKAIKYSALDYLLKPVNIEELQNVVKKAVIKSSNKTVNNQFGVLFSQYKNNANTTASLAVPTVEGLLFYDLDEIIRIEASGAYTIIYSVKREKVVSSKNIKEYELQLPTENFYRVHNSHIINIKRLLKYDKGRGGLLTMEDSSVVELATRRKAGFLKLFR
jgi:two-component system, LytTR family, response regulator